MAIILDKHNEIKTSYLDFIDALELKKDGLRCCFNIDMIVYEYTPTHFDDLKLVPLEDFSCKRTIIGNHNTKVNIESSFGLIQEDYITIDLKVVELDQNNYMWKGMLITRTNPYFEILNQLAKHFDFVGADNTNSFVLDESELSEIQLVPFRLKCVDHKFVLSDIESEMATSEYDAIVDSLHCDEVAL